MKGNERNMKKTTLAILALFLGLMTLCACRGKTDMPLPLESNVPTPAQQPTQSPTPIPTPTPSPAPTPNPIGTYATIIKGNENRHENIRIAAKSIDGIILGPGEEFSFNRTVGQRTPDRGFKEAPAYVGGVLKDQFGGGICQVSSTLFAAARMCPESIIEITEDHRHSRPVTYVPEGWDATVDWDSNKDLCFRNLGNSDIYIEIILEDDEITVTYYTVT